MSEILISIASVMGIVDFFMGLIVLYNMIKCIFNPVFIKAKLCSFIFAIVVLSFIVLGLDILIPNIIEKPIPLFITCLCTFILLIFVEFKFIKCNKYNQYSIKQLDIMDGHTFEYACANILKSNGFKNVEVTRGSGDFGVDIVAENNGIKYAVQCKCYSHKLDNTPIQEVIGGLAYYHCQEAIVITNNYFTESAKTLAKINNVELFDRDKLIKLISNTKSQIKRNKSTHCKDKSNNNATPLINNERKIELYEFARNISRECIKKDFIQYLTDFLNETSEKIYFYYTEIKEYPIKSIDSNFDLENKEAYYYYKLKYGTFISKIKRTKTELIEYLDSKYIKIDINRDMDNTIKITVPFPERISNLYK